ncbi:MAG: endopeptidase La [Bdellovibrionales bacterium]|nr:endopeptidase La [Bdellovibrionales bacterium]
MSREKKKSGSSSNTKAVVPMLPLREVIIFPHMVVPLFVGREKSIAALEAAITHKLDLFLCAQRDASVVNPNQGDLYEIGTLGTIIQLVKLPDNTVKVLVEGKKRARVLDYVPNDQFIQVEVQELPEDGVDAVKLEALLRGVKTTFEEYVKFNKRIPPEVVMNINGINEPARLADTVVAHLTLKIDEKQKILEIVDTSERLERILSLMQGEIEILQVERKIRSRVKKQMERNQKEYYLNEQMSAIQKELGEKDEFKVELAEIEKKIATKKLSKEARDKVQKEFRKLKMMSPMSAEATVVRNYIDWILTLPWGEYTEDNWDLNHADKVLQEDHYGLDEVRERILEYLSVRTLTRSSKGSILCLAGPPGVGKTSLARSIARSIGKNFVRASLGGVRDEAEIRGHRRTYVGALPGKLIQSLKKAGSANPVFLLDEIDKMSSDFRGDPASALLEVLDPEQNQSFMDHYLEVEFDLSKVMFVLTANSLHQIPRPLLDRMEVITLPGYTMNEKLHIGQKYLLPKQVDLHGLRKDKVIVPEETMRALVNGYTREAGVRNLERELAGLCRKVAHQIVRKHGGKIADFLKKTEKAEAAVEEPESEAKPAKRRPRFDRHKMKELSYEKVTITPKMVEKYLGVPKYSISKAEEKAEIGLTNGLAWTESGGDMLQIEVAVLPGKGNLKVTGKLGDVMQESAQAAMSYVRGRAAAMGLAPDFYDKIDVHIHVPEGSVPKDGPSAGITMATTLASAFLRVPVKRNVAMTGEITLRGHVLAIGGLKEKLIAAKLGGCDTVIFPKENEKDLVKMSKEILDGLKLHPVEHADEVLRLALDVPDSANFMRPKDVSAAEKAAQGEIAKKKGGGAGKPSLPSVPQQ